MSVINRPETSFDGASHTYGLEGWADEDVVGVSSAAKIGQALEAFDIGSRWGFRLGYEGAHELATQHNALKPFDVEFATREGVKTVCVESQDDLREAMSGRGLTPWSKRDKAADRGNWVHDVLEALGQDNAVPKLEVFSEEVRGHVKSVLAWYIKHRPTFIATEVQVSSLTHGFAGRYDIRAEIDARKLEPLFDAHDTPQAERVRGLALLRKPALCLIDLKTSKDIYPTTHFPQLALYELAGVEMGFPVTDCQLVLNSKPDGSEAVMGASWVEPSEVVVFVEAYRTIKRIVAADPEEKLKKMRQEDVLLILREGPRWARELSEKGSTLESLDGRAIGRICGGLRKRRLVQQDERGRWSLA